MSLVRLARRAVETYLRDSRVVESTTEPVDEAGVFVTINYLTRNGEERLRGCIGFPLPYKTLPRSVVEAAIAAATADPRFPPVDLAELASTIFEVSVLTTPVELRAGPLGFKNAIRIGKDGLLLKWKHGSGLLLPQVPVEMHWDADEFLVNLCYKAGAATDVLRDASSRLYTFQAIVFKELEPGGEVARVQL